MESHLLLKEDEFYKENEKLELKTKQLMQQVNNVMKIQDNLIKDTLKTQSEISIIKQNTKFPRKCIEDGVLLPEEPQNNEEPVGINMGVIRIYKAKLKSLVAEKERVQSELKLKVEEAKKLQKENQALKEEKEKWFLLYNSGKNNIGKLESHLANSNAKLQSKDTETMCLKKELEHLKKELKTTTLILNNCEVRLSRACEEADKLKLALKQCRDEEKDLKETYRKQMNELAANLKQMQKQKVELLNGFKKQMQLIDVLQKQKVHLEALKLSEISEAEYLKILNWKFD